MDGNDYRCIEQLGIRYAAMIDERDFQAFAATFTVDGVYAVSAGEQRGREAIAAFAERAVGHLAGTQHLATNFLIELAGDNAKMRSTFIATHIGSGEFEGQHFIIGGVYKDNVKRVDGEWLFSRREIIPVWAKGEKEMLGVTTRDDL